MTMEATHTAQYINERKSEATIIIIVIEEEP